MKPKDLKHPFCFAMRRPLLQGRVFFVPDYYYEHHLFSFPSFTDLFSNDHPVHLEYCSGNGTWIAERAQADPKINWVAVEKDFERVRKIVSKGINYNIKNLFVICGEALTFTKHYLKEEVLSQIHVNFPDPWPKKRHAKHRLFQLPFALEMARVLKSEKEAIIVTDDSHYSGQICDVMLASGVWEERYPRLHYITEWEGYGSSFFETLWREKGREIRYIQMKKKRPSPSCKDLLMGCITHRSRGI